MSSIDTQRSSMKNSQTSISPVRELVPSAHVCGTITARPKHDRAYSADNTTAGKQSTTSRLNALAPEFYPSGSPPLPSEEHKCTDIQKNTPLFAFGTPTQESLQHTIHTSTLQACSHILKDWQDANFSKTHTLLYRRCRQGSRVRICVNSIVIVEDTDNMNRERL